MFLMYFEILLPVEYKAVQQKLDISRAPRRAQSRTQEYRGFQQWWNEISTNASIESTG